MGDWLTGNWWTGDWWNRYKRIGKGEKTFKNKNFAAAFSTNQSPFYQSPITQSPFYPAFAKATASKQSTMHKITADWVCPVSSEPLENAVVIPDDTGKILAVEPRDKHDPTAKSVTAPATGARHFATRAAVTAANRGPDPRVVLMERPVRGWDPMSEGEVKQAVIGLRRSGAGVLISDYNVKSMLDVMDRVYVLHEGRIIFTGGAKFMMDSPVVRHLYLGESYSF